MFIKKDTRKIPQILNDATSRAVASPSSANANPANSDNEKELDNGIISEMRFARRAPEFLPSCNVAMLLEPKYRPALDHLVQLSLYDCGLQTLAGIEQSTDSNISGSTIFPKLESLDIGRNQKLTNDAIPDTFHTQFPQLTQLWSDDCSFGPNIPSTLLELQNLQVVRITGNQLEGALDAGIGIRYWKELKVLALDGNKLSSIGKGIGLMRHLEKLHLRGNNISSLPDEGVPSASNSSLGMFSLSSNKLSSIPLSLVNVGATLKELYLNGNEIEEFPEGLAEKLVVLTKLNLAHNSIGKSGNLTAGSQSSSGANDDDETMEDTDDFLAQQLPQDFVQRFGMPEPLTGKCIKEGECMVRMEGNPMAEAITKRYLEEEERKAKEMAMETEVIEE